MLAYQSFGVVYGDLSVSPLYVFRSTFSGDLHNHVTVEEIYGVLSLIFWTLTMVPVVKYVIIILSADDNGEGNSPASLSLSLWSHESHNIVRWDDELMLPLCVSGGTFALYSLLCRHAKLSLILNQQTADAELSTYKLDQPPATPRGERVRKLLEKHSFLRTSLLVIVLLGTCMSIGDGILTPSIAGLSCPRFYPSHGKVSRISPTLTLVRNFSWVGAVLSATSGISVAAPQLHQSEPITVILCIWAGVLGFGFAGFWGNLRVMDGGVGGRCGGAGVVLHFGVAVWDTAYWDTPDLVSVCAGGAALALLQQQHRGVQPHHVQPWHHPRAVAILHLPLLQSLREGRLGFPRWCPPLHHRYVVTSIISHS
jgi:hypothetical protein